jgi:hypothetical protein
MDLNSSNSTESICIDTKTNKPLIYNHKPSVIDGSMLHCLNNYL